MLKTAIIPSLFAIAYLAGRFRAFVRDWAVFIGAVVLFDDCRGLVYGLMQHFELPVHMGYVIDAEHALFGEPIAVDCAAAAPLRSRESARSRRRSSWSTRRTS